MEKFLLEPENERPRSLLDSPPKPKVPPPKPPKLPPQHVYAPLPALGALSIGFLSSKKDPIKEEADFRLLVNGKTNNMLSTWG
jgi:hypothetical protein